MTTSFKQGIQFYIKKQYANSFACFNRLINLEITTQLERSISLWHLAIMYKCGLGTPKDIEKAMEYFHQSGKLNYGPSWFSLGFIYEDGKLTTQDLEKALNCYTAGAIIGDINCQINLGSMYDEGKGVPINKSLAFKWFQNAAEQGDIDATFNVGLMYQYGESVPQDVAKAQRHFCDAGEYSFGIYGNVPFNSVQVLRTTSKQFQNQTQNCNAPENIDGTELYDFTNTCFTAIAQQYVE